MNTGRWWDFAGPDAKSRGMLNLLPQNSPWRFIKAKIFLFVTILQLATTKYFLLSGSVKVLFIGNFFKRNFEPVPCRKWIVENLPFLTIHPEKLSIISYSRNMNKTDVCWMLINESTISFIQFFFRYKKYC